MLGLIQEQHPARCRLFLDWKGIDWPILVDSLNRTGVWAVPLTWSIDEHGVLRSTNPDPKWILGEFLEKDWPEPSVEDRLAAQEDPRGRPSSIEALYLAGRYGRAIEAAEKELAEREDAATFFLLGCAHRARYDSPSRVAGDFQSAVRAWTRASALAPRNYIYRRRIQQYGPRLAKPYPFYDWISEARRAIVESGRVPPALLAEPEGSELAAPMRAFQGASTIAEEPDPNGEIDLDSMQLLGFDSVLAPSPVHAGEAFRAYLRLTPSKTLAAYFDDEAGPLVVWLDPPGGMETPSRRVRYEPDSKTAKEKADGRSMRSIEVEVRTSRDLKPGKHVLKGYALGHVCEDANGVCRYVRKNFSVEVDVLPAKPQRNRRRNSRRR